MVKGIEFLWSSERFYDKERSCKKQSQYPKAAAQATEQDALH
jgi:hypothetical protein